MSQNILLEIADFSPRSLQFPNGWAGHLPFAAWVIQEVSPKIFVELGTHSGNSYFSFCQSVVEAGIATKCYAVDTWQGDEHAGSYNDEIFAKVNAHHQEHYAGFSRLMRMTFDDAVSYFADESIELLHIDGLHTYEAVRHDFETWLPKLAPGAVVLFHDTNVRERSFGVWKLWEELQAHYPNNLEFVHSHGLGVLQLINAPEEKILHWLQPNHPEKQRLINFFAALGSRQLERFELYELKRHTASLNQAVAERDGQLASLNQAIAERDGQLASLNQAVVERDEHLASLNQAVVERDEQLASLNQAVVERDGQLASLNKAVAKRDGQLASLNKAVVVRDGQLTSLNQAVADRDGQLTSLNQAVVVREGQIASLNQAVADREGQIANLNQIVIDLNQAVADRDGQITVILSSTSWRITAPFRKGARRMRRAVATLQLGLFSVARYIYRCLPVSDRTRLRIKAFTLKYFGQVLGRPNMLCTSSGRVVRSLKCVGAQDHQNALENSRDITSYLMAHADELPENAACPVTRFMFYIWKSRLDLQRAFDLHNPESRIEYCKWFLVDASSEFGFPAEAYPDELLVALSKGDDCNITRKALAVLNEKKKVNAIPDKQGAYSMGHAIPQCFPDGANLIGYARGEFGMGEHVRMVARAFAAAGVPFSVVDHAAMGVHGSDDDSIEHWVVNAQLHTANIFHINADVFPSLYFHLGKEFFKQHYNIGYWAWELSKCPLDFDLALNMVDEVWAISEFVCDSFKARSPVPVIYMPLAVSIPELQRSYSKEYFGLSEGSFHFLFTFDAASYLDRKNPIATVRAFKTAFPIGDEKVELVLKTMNIPTEEPLWQALMHEVREDARIRLISKRLMRDEVLGLNSVCDVFVSLHRSEGFGRCLAESMLLGKPVIATNYSGSRDFAREGTACVVDYKLVPVSEGSYPFWQGQEWAEPDIEQAGFLMRKLFEDEGFRTRISQAGQHFVEKNFSEEVIGKRYATRLKELKRRGFQRLSPLTDQGDSSGNDITELEDEIVGFIDLPITGDEERAVQSGTIDIAGWAVSKSGIEKIEIYCDEKVVGEAHYGILRQDVAETFQEFCNPGRSGFFWRLDTTKLLEGQHVFKVSAHSRSGKMADWKQRFSVGDVNTLYGQWIAKNELTKTKRSELCAEIEGTNGTLLISIVAMADAGINSETLSRTLDSLKGQLHREWELVICVESTDAPRVQALLDVSDAGSRVSLVTFAKPTWKEIFGLCRGDYIGVINVGDVLDPRALMAVEINVAATPNVGLVYADDDRLEDGNRIDPRFKPAWSPIYLQNYNYIGRPWFGSAPLLRGIAIVDEQCNSTTEHSLLTRLGDVVDKVIHVPMVLCSRQADALLKYGSDQNSVHDEDEYSDSASWQLPGQNILPLVSVVIPTCLRNLDIIEKCFSSLLMCTDYPNLEVIVVTNNVVDEDEAKRFLERWPFKVISWNGSFSWSGINNLGAQHAAGELLLFMNDDVEALNPDWLTNMVAMANRSSVGVVGAMLVYPNQTIQHGGIFFVSYGGGARHLFRFCTGAEAQIAPMVNHSRESSAVTGACLLSRREVFESVKGFDEMLPLVANDTDYCLRVEEKGFACVVVADATLVHHEGISRAGMPETEDVKRFWARWKNRLESDDPFSNPNIDDGQDDWRLNPNVICTLNGRVRSGARGATTTISLRGVED